MSVDNRAYPIGVNPPNPETRHTEALVMLAAKFSTAASKARNRRYSQRMRDAHAKIAERLAYAAQCVREVATLREQVERLRPYEAFVQDADFKKVARKMVKRIKEDARIYMPSGAITGMMVPAESFKNVDDAEWVRVNDLTAVIAAALPDALRAWAKARGTDA